MRRIISLLLIIAAGCQRIEMKENADMKAVYRINCGSSEAYIDNKGRVWSADQGFVEGKTAAREATLPIHNTAAPEIYRTERYGMERYTLPVTQGLYTIRLHFAEEFDCNFKAGERSFDICINGRPVAEKLDPYRASGGFANPVVIEYAGCPAKDRIDIQFSGSAMINGIEIFNAASAEPEAVRQTTPVASSNAFFIGNRIKTSTAAHPLKILFIGNSMTFFWAIPESLQAMLETGTQNLRIEPQRSLHGGKWLEYHYNQTDAVSLIKTGGFDYVVLQEGTTTPLKRPDEFFEYVEKFNRVIRESGAKPLLYAASLNVYSTDAEYRELMRLVAEAGKRIDAPVIPGCETLRLCRSERPDLIWHNADTVHMGMHGGYAVACTFYAAFTGGDSFPPPAILAQQVAIDPETAAFIQKKALQAVQEFCPNRPVVIP